MAYGLSENDILNLLGDGTVSDLDESDEEIIENFQNEELNNLSGQFDEWEDFIIDHDSVLLEQLEFNLPSPEPNIANVTPEPFVISNKNQIKWQASPFKQPNINLDDLEDMIYPSEMPSVLDYFTEYLDDTDFSNMAYFTNLYSVQKQQSRFKPTDASEIKTFIGIHIIMSCLKYPRIRL